MSNPDDIVGHKTFNDGHGGFRHEPLTRAEADAIWARCEELKAKRAADMPDVPTAIRAFTDAYRRLEELGFGNATGCPKDGSEFEVIEAGSSGIHRCIYMGEWPTGSWWILHDGDMSPSRPVLWRRIGSCAHLFKRDDCENCGGREVPPLDLKAILSKLHTSEKALASSVEAETVAMNAVRSLESRLHQGLEIAQCVQRMTDTGEMTEAIDKLIELLRDGVERQER